MADAREPLLNEIALLAAEANCENEPEIEAALMLIVRGMRFAPSVRRRLVNVCADVVGFAEWMEATVPAHAVPKDRCIR